MTTAKAYTRDLPLSPLEKGKLRLYSMRFCAFAQRSRNVLEHYKVPYETINIHFKSKPDWFWERNPNGRVPIYEKDGQILYESGVLCDFIEEVYGNGELYPKDPFQKAQVKLLMESATKVTGPYYKLFFAKVDDPNLNEHVETLHKGLEFFEGHLENTFLSGTSVSMADYYLWPHIEPLEALSEKVNADLLSKDKFPKLNAWVAAMKTTPGVKATMQPTVIHSGYMDTVKAGKPNYDYGLKLDSE